MISRIKSMALFMVAVSVLLPVKLLAQESRDKINPDNPPAITEILSSKFTMSKPGRGILQVTMRIQPRWYTHSTTQKRMANGNGPFATEFRTKPSYDFRITGPFTTNAKMSIHRDLIFPGLDLERLEGTITWCAPIELGKNVDPQRVKIAGHVRCIVESPTNARPGHLVFVARYQKLELNPKPPKLKLMRPNQRVATDLFNAREWPSRIFCITGGIRPVQPALRLLHK